MSVRDVGRAALVAMMAVVVNPCAADSVTINPSKDNTLHEEASGLLSNALGPMFCGRTGANNGNKMRRLVIAFDVAAAVPAGSTITGATLRLNLEQGSPSSGNQSHSLYRLLRNWGEGASSAFGGAGAPSTANDATWLHTFYSTQFWDNAGGDFAGVVSATQTVGLVPGFLSWTSPEMIADVQSWRDRPGCNFGWIMRGNEANTNTSKKFSSGEAFDPATRPELIIDFTPPAVQCPADIDDNNIVGVGDLLTVISAWGNCQACPASCDADIAPGTGDQNVGVADLLAVIGQWGPCS